MNYEILRHINNLYDHVETLNSQIDSLNRQNLRESSRNDRNRSFYYENPVYIPPLYDLAPRRSLNSYQLLSDMRTRLNNRINRLNQETQNLNQETQNLNSTNTHRNNLSRGRVNTTNPINTTNPRNPINPNTTNPINQNRTNTINQNRTNTTSIETNTTTPFNENFATSFAQRVHNILTSVNNDIIPTNIQIETHTQVIVSHKSVSNNTTIEIFNNEDSASSAQEDLASSAQEESSSQDSSNEYKCLICMDIIRKNDVVRRLNKCNHVFHVGCIDKWFEQKITCPTCRQDIRELPTVNVNIDDDDFNEV